MSQYLDKLTVYTVMQVIKHKYIIWLCVGHFYNVTAVAGTDVVTMILSIMNDMI